jgi:hypothetical protein
LPEEAGGSVFVLEKMRTGRCRMQTTIYYSEEDAYLMEQVDAKGRRERRSRSAVLLSVLEEHFEREKRLGEILVDLGALSHFDLAKGLDLQKGQFAEKLLGDVLLEQELVDKEAVDRALIIQGRHKEI